MHVQKLARAAIEISLFQSVAEWMNVLLRRNDVAKINLHCKSNRLITHC